MNQLWEMSKELQENPNPSLTDSLIIALVRHMYFDFEAIRQETHL